MADIQFDEEQQYQQTRQVEQKPFLVQLVLSTGIVSTDKQAEYMLLGFVAFAIIISFFLLYGGSFSSRSNTAPPPPQGLNSYVIPS